MYHRIDRELKSEGEDREREINDIREIGATRNDETAAESFSRLTRFDSSFGVAPIYIISLLSPPKSIIIPERDYFNLESHKFTRNCFSWLVSRNYNFTINITIEIFATKFYALPSSFDQPMYACINKINK